MVVNATKTSQPLQAGFLARLFFHMQPQPMDRQKVTDRLIEIAEPVCAGAGYELVNVEYTMGPQGWVVRFFIDHRAGTASPDSAISFADCEAVSRELSAVLDVEDPIPHAYSLEVSSPGVARPLRTAEHFRRFVGETAKVTLDKGVSGRRNFRGLLVGVEPEREAADRDFLIEIDVDGVKYKLPLSDVASANLVPDWDSLIAGKARKQR